MTFYCLQQQDKDVYKLIETEKRRKTGDEESQEDDTLEITI